MNDRRQSPAEAKAKDFGLQVRMKCGPDVVIAVDRKGQTWQVTAPQSHQVKRYRLTPKCADLCRPGIELQRPHLC